MPKTWLITGTSTGLGRTLTEKLLARGDTVVATVRRLEVLGDLQRQYPKTLAVLRLDLTDLAGLRQAVEQAFRLHPRIDIVVSNAAYGLIGAAEELADADIDRQIATNLTGTLQFIRAVLPHLRAQGGGRLVQVSSEGGQIAYPAFSLYHATKWGIEGFLEAVAQEVAPFGIDCLIVEPGATATNFGTGIVLAPAMAVYEATPAGAVRQMIQQGRFEIRGDAARTVAAMITAADSEQPPFRLPLGSTAHANLTRELKKRLEEIAGQREVACSADRPAAQ